MKGDNKHHLNMRYVMIMLEHFFQLATGFKHLIIMLEREGEFYKKLAPSASTSAAALGSLSVATAIMRIAEKHVKEDQLISLVNAQIGYDKPRTISDASPIQVEVVYERGGVISVID